MKKMMLGLAACITALLIFQSFIHRKPADTQEPIPLVQYPPAHAPQTRSAQLVTSVAAPANDDVDPETEAALNRFGLSAKIGVKVGVAAKFRDPIYAAADSNDK